MRRVILSGIRYNIVTEFPRYISQDLCQAVRGMVLQSAICGAVACSMNRHLAGSSVDKGDRRYPHVTVYFLHQPIGKETPPEGLGVVDCRVNTGWF